MRRRAGQRRTEQANRARVNNLLRRVSVLNTSALAWVLEGMIDDEDNVEEFRDVEMFHGVGFKARPPEGSDPEVLLACLGGYSSHAVGVASRDAKTEKSFDAAVELAADETAVYNSQATLLIRADGTVEARTLSGVAVPLALKSDVEGLRDAITGTTPASPGGGNAIIASVTAWGGMGNPVGTSKLKGE